MLTLHDASQNNLVFKPWSVEIPEMLQMNVGLSLSFESWWPTRVLADLVDMD